MTRVIIEGLRDRASLINALSAVLDALNDDEAYAYEEHVFTPLPTRTAQAETEGPAFESDPADGMELVPGPTPFVPCPRRGTHQSLTECWMCWCDVMRGAALEPEVLTRAVWREANGYWATA